MRRIVGAMGGEWNRYATIPGQYDTLNIPLDGKIIVIERPLIRTGGETRGHRVNIEGSEDNPNGGISDNVFNFLKELLRMERGVSNHWFSETDSFKKYNRKELEDMFDLDTVCD